MKRPSLRSWASQALVAAVAVGVVVAAPLAARNQAPADGVVISGARSLSDQVSVSYKALDSGHQATIFAGDNIGASPLANGLFFEEPVTIASNLMHVDFASVGNHEFDKGKEELLRIQNGGCRPVDGCTAAPYRLANGTTTTVYP